LKQSGLVNAAALPPSEPFVIFLPSQKLFCIPPPPVLLQALICGGITVGNDVFRSWWRGRAGCAGEGDKVQNE
jgi:hypothetical protein